MPRITTTIKKKKRKDVIGHLLEVSRGLKKRPLGAKMIIPTEGESSLDNLSWVLYQEYGVRGPYEIFPRVKDALSFPASKDFDPVGIGKLAKANTKLKSVGGIQNLEVSKPDDLYAGYIVQEFVIHPGYEAKHFIRDTLAETRPDVKAFKAEIEGEIAVLGSHDKRFNHEKIGAILVKHLKEVKEAIAQKLEILLPQRRFDDGKLEGQQPADVFRRRVKIVRAARFSDDEDKR